MWISEKTAISLIQTLLVLGAVAGRPTAGGASDLRLEPLLTGVVSYDFDHQISADGRFIVYQAILSGYEWIEVFDRKTYSSSTASKSTAGTNANDDSGEPAISPDGRYIAFHSKGTNLVAGDTNTVRDVFLRDQVAGTTERVSLSHSGSEADAGCLSAAMSGDARFVAFVSSATNLVAGDLNGRQDVFLRDRLLGTTERVSVATGGAEGNGHSWFPAVSSDGRYVAFFSDASSLVSGDTNLRRDTFLRDRLAGTTTRISVDSAGNQADHNSDPLTSTKPQISADGRYVAFVSAATNLVAADTNGEDDIFVHDRITGSTERVSVGIGGKQGTEASDSPSISADGRYVLFHTDSPLQGGQYGGVFLRDRINGTTRKLFANPSASSTWHAADLDGDARYALATYHQGFLANMNEYIMSDCSGVVCGDGVTTLGCEKCDDANTNDFDGCSSSCTLEGCHTCSGEPTVCTPHANGTACDDNNACTPTQTCSGGRCLGTDTCLDILCPGSPNPCVVQGNVSVVDGGSVDLEGRALQLAQNATIASTTNGGSFSLVNASQVTMEKGSKLVSDGAGVNGGSILVGSNGPCSLSGRITASGKDKVAGGGDGGTVSVQCGGITVSPGSSIDANGLLGSGGNITLDAGSGPMTVTGARFSARGQGFPGGNLSLAGDAACTLQAQVMVDATTVVDEGERFNGNGGTTQVRCGGDVHFLKGSKLTLSTKPQSDVLAGSLALESASGQVVLDQGTKVTSSGSDRGDDTGTLSITASETCQLGGAMVSSSQGSDGPTLQIACGNLILEQSASISLTNAGGRGGNLRGSVGGTCALDGKVKLGARANGSAGEGGSIDLICGQDISIGEKALFDVSGSGKASAEFGSQGSSGGGISLTSTGGSASVAGKLIAKGKGTGGATLIEACDVHVDTTGKLIVDAASGGSNSLVAHEALTIEGAASAKGPSPGSNDFSYRTTGSVTNPQLISPASVPVQNPALTACP